MFRRSLAIAAVACGLSVSAHAATISQTFEINPFAAGPVVDVAGGGWTRERGKSRHVFAGFDTALGRITSARLIIDESWSLDAMLLSNEDDSAGTHRGKGLANTRVKIGTNRTTEGGVFNQRLSNIRTKNARCTTFAIGESCTATQTTFASETHEFLFDAARAEDLFLDPRAMRIIWNVGSRIRGDGTVTTSLYDGSINATLEVNYASVPLPASGAMLFTAFAGFVTLRRHRKPS